MKPIRLEFTGLNSYRTRQVVDFQTLGADGLFGIFGPTGSGKSTILDAITLALYGGVDRTVNNTRGIIHQLENSLEVSFQFQLGECRYLVDRRYERNPKDPEAATAKQARLRRLGSNQEEVLASKPQEVNAKIEEILGIRRDEFLRAVVLPQGKFDQFLRMTGGDRAAMLEHLFGLERFGEELAAKVKNEAAICAGQLQQVEGEERGLGDCSQETVAQALMDLMVKRDESVAVQKHYEEVDQAFQKASALQELFLKRRAAQEKQARLEQEREIIAEQQYRLDKAERAEPLRELINRRKELNGKIAQETIRYQEKLRSHDDAVIKHHEAKARLELAEKAWNEQSPQLQGKKVQYQGALEKKRKLEELQKNAAQKRNEAEALGKTLSRLEKEIAACQGDLDHIRNTLTPLQDNRSRMIMDPEEKETVARGLEVLQHLEEAERRLEEKRRIYLDRETKTREYWDGLVEQIRQMLPEKEIAIGENIEELVKAYLSRTEQDLAASREDLQRALIRGSAAELAKELHDGEPCPVCGALEHPRPAQITEEIDQLKATVKKAERNLKDVRNWEEAVLKLFHDWENNNTLVREARAEMDRAEQEASKVLAEFYGIRCPFDREGLRRRKDELAELERQLQKIDKEREALLKAQEELNGRFGKLNQSYQAMRVNEASLRTDLNNLTTQIGEISGELQQISNGKDPILLIQKVDQIMQQLRRAVEDAKNNETETRGKADALAMELSALEATLTANREELGGIEGRLAAGLKDAGFTSAAEAEAVLMEAAARQSIRKQLEQYRQEVAVARNELERLDREIDNRPFDEAKFEEIKTRRESLFREADRLKTETALAQSKLNELKKKQERWNELQKQKALVERRKNLADELGMLLRGRKFVSFLAQEHLRDMALEASYQLGRLTGQRYALELAKDKDCEFVIRDDYNGGNRRMVNSLSGGEIFLTSLSLALALSSKIQLRGRYPLGFFFLDEGFGTLDQEKLDKVVSALEKLHDKNRMVGVISHVRELKERLPRYLEVTPAGEDGSGSEIKYVKN